MAHTLKAEPPGRQAADQGPRLECPDQCGPLRLLLTTQQATQPQAGPSLPCAPLLTATSEAVHP